MKAFFILAAGLLIGHGASAATYRCTAAGDGSKTIDSFTLVKLSRGGSATIEFHPTGDSKGWDLSPTSSGRRSNRNHHSGLVAPNGTAEYSPGAHAEEFNKGIAHDPTQPVFVAAIFLSQGIIQDKNTGYVQVEYRYESGSGAPMHIRKYDCK